MKLLRCIGFFFFLGLLMGWVGCFSTGPLSHDIPNFAVIDPVRGIYRGGQPTTEGWKYLASLGVTNVVKLNLKSEAEDAPGFNVFYRPITIEQQLGVSQLWRAEIEASATHMMLGHVFLHCEHGNDRTGLVAATYRVEAQKWSKADAEKEMLAMGFHKELVGLWRFWGNFQP